MSKIVGDKELIAKLNRVGSLTFLRPAMQSSIVHVESIAKNYPPTTNANTPKADKPWYERGYGTKWRRGDGSIGGRATSEQLGDRWTNRVESATRAKTENPVSYGDYVMGQEQSSVLAKIGWKTTDTIAEETTAEVLKTIQGAVDRELARL